MGSKVGHVAPGFGFLVIGLWQLYNHMKLYSLHPSGYRAIIWFPAPKLRHLELLLTAAGSLTSIAMELFVGPSRHQPLDSDWTIPSNHLHNFEHASISLSILVYTAVSAAFDHASPSHPAGELLCLLTAANAFAQELFLFHLHSTDHTGLEGHYHFLLQIVIVVSLVTTLMGISHPRSFAVGFIRSASIAFQGVWFIFLGYMLWTPEFIPKGCHMNDEDGHFVVRCRSEVALQRAKSIANLEFSWLVTGAIVFLVLLYLFISRRYAEEAEYLFINGNAAREEEMEALEGGGEEHYKKFGYSAFKN